MCLWGAWPGIYGVTMGLGSGVLGPSLLWPGALVHDHEALRWIGTPRFGIFSKFARGGPAPGYREVGANPALLFAWRTFRDDLSGRSSPHPFLDQQGQWNH